MSCVVAPCFDALLAPYALKPLNRVVLWYGMLPNGNLGSAEAVLYVECCQNEEKHPECEMRTMRKVPCLAAAGVYFRSAVSFLSP